MIKNKYKVVQLIKQTDHKRLEKCITNDNNTVIAKSYAISDGKYAQNEVNTFQLIKQPLHHGFPQIKEAFQESGRAYLIMQELGENLDALRRRCGGRLGLKTVLMVGLQILDRIQYLHKCGLLHGDIKPSNFLVGKGKLKHKIYLADFEFSTPYMKGDKHISEEVKEKFSGSLRFSSRAANSKSTFARKDELQSWLYSLIFLLNGELPWMNISSKTIQDANEQVLMLKNKNQAELLTGLPPVFGQLFTYLNQLKFAATPDYSKIKGLLNGLMKKNGYDWDYKYDWQYL